MKKILCHILLLVSPNVMIFSRENHEIIGKEVAAAFKNGGPESLKQWLKHNDHRVNTEIIVLFAELGVDWKSEHLINIALILAQNKGHQATLTKTYHYIGDYYLVIQDFQQAMNNYNKALTRYRNTNDLNGQGLILFNQANIHFVQCNYDFAVQNCAKAAELFQETGSLKELADTYRFQGDVYSYTGDNTRALEMYEKAMVLYVNTKNIKAQGSVYLKKAAVYQKKGYLDHMQKMYDNALHCFQEAKDPGGQGNVYFNKGERYLKSKKYADAHDMYDNALTFFNREEDRTSRANATYRKGLVYFETGDYENAMKMCKEAQYLYKKERDLRMLSELDITIALIYFNRGESLKAIGILEKALQVYEKLKAPEGIANVCRFLGRVLLSIGSNKRAQEVNQRALLLYEKAGNTVGRGYIYLNIGSGYFFSGDYSEARKMYEKALHLFDKQGEQEGKGNVYYKLAEIHLSCGDILKALIMYDKALYYYKNAGSLISQCEVYRGMGYIYSIIGDRLKAIEMTDKYLELCKKYGDLTGQGAAYIGKAIIFADQEKYPEAVDMNNEALSILEAANSPWGKGWVYLNQARIYLKTNEWTKAEEYSNKALAVFKKLKYPQAYSHVYENLGDIFLQKKNWTNARKMYEKALQIYIDLSDIESQSSIFIKRGAALLMDGRKKDGVESIEKGFVNFEKYRRQTAVPRMKKVLMEEYYQHYELAARGMISIKEYERAFKYVESIKARVFLDQLTEGVDKLKKGITPELMKQRDELIATLSMQGKKISEASAKNTIEHLKRFKENYRETERKLEDLLVKIRLKNPLYASVSYPEPITIQELQENILKKEEMLVRYFLSGDKVHVFLVSNNDFQEVTLEITTKEIEKKVGEYLKPFRQPAYRRRRNIKIIDRWMLNRGKSLYRSIFKPIESKLKGKKQILIVPDGELANVPFESFVVDEKSSGKPIFLLERYRIKYFQSASVLATTRKQDNHKGKTNLFVGFGDPVYDYENFKKERQEKSSPAPEKGDRLLEINRGKYNREGGVYSRLKASGKEVEAIAALFNKRTKGNTKYARERANEENAKAPGMMQYGYIHFSCHGILGGGFQSLVLSQVPGAKEDGYFTLNEIMNCTYNAKLVVLSACRTGTGKMERAEGVTGLTRAFMYAGTPAVVASLWNVDDKGTKELMVRFYRNMLEEGMSKEEALRKAKLELIKDRRFASPYYWSAFVQYGE